MRWILALTLLYAALATRADGIAYGKSFMMLRETDQAAVINIDEKTVDVSMFIAISGIPAGETITYVLPFWYRSDGFAMEEMDSRDYRWKYVNPVGDKIERMNRIAEGKAHVNVLKAAGVFGLGFLGPFLMDPEGRPRQGVMTGAATASSSLVPYEVHTTAHARAEIYKIQAKDLQQLVAQAGLPAKYAEPLKKYRTPYFAVMRLTGMKAPAEKKAPFGNRGVCYHFHHAIPPEKRGEYVYPLGTGAAWPKPIVLTEVYVACPDTCVLKAAAPEIGKRENTETFYQNIRFLSDLSGETLSEREKRELLSPKTAGLLRDNVTAPSAWHIAYFNSNPNEDITIKLTPRAAPWRLQLADALTQPGEILYWRSLPWPLFLCAGVFMLVSWVIAGLVIIRPRWQRAGKPGALIRHILLAILTAGFYFSAGVILLLLLRAVISGLIQTFTWDIAAVLQTISSLAVSAFVVMAMAVLARSLSGLQQKAEWRKRLALHSWLLATAIYLALNGALYWFVWWCESAI